MHLDGNILLRSTNQMRIGVNFTLKFLLVALPTQILRPVLIQPKSPIFTASTRPGGNKTTLLSTRDFLPVARQASVSFSMAIGLNLVGLSRIILHLDQIHNANYMQGIDFYRHAVINNTSWDYSTINGSTVALADQINPGGINAYDPDLRPFQKRGGKVLEYHGYQDQVIPSKASMEWYQKVYGFYGALGETEELEDFYRLFMVPGMRHCSGGDGGKFPFKFIGIGMIY